MSEEAGLCLRIREVGLDNTSFWLSKLAELGVKSPSSLRHIEQDIGAYNFLAAKAEFMVEKKALLELLKINRSDLLISANFDKKQLIEEVQLWNKEKYVTADEMEKRLQYLIKVKRSIYSKLSDPNVWLNDILLASSVQEYLISLVNYDLEVPGIKKYMQEIIDLKELIFIDHQSFPQIEQISNWLYKPNKTFNMKDIIDFSSFNEFLAKTRENEMLTKKLRSSEALANHISDGFYHLRLNYKETYDDVFIISLVHPFVKDSYHNILSLKPLKVKELEFIQKTFSEQRENFETYKTKKVILLQTYLFLLVLHTSYNDSNRGKIIFLKQIYQMMKDLDPPLENDLLELLHAYFSGSSSGNLIQCLKGLIQPPCQGRSKKLSLQSPLVLDSDNLVMKEPLEEISKELTTLSYCEDEFFVLHKNAEAHNMFERLELCMYYPKKLHLSDALCIREESLMLSLNENPVTDPKQLPLLIIHKLMSYDCLCRSDLMPIVHENEPDELADLEDELQISPSEGVSQGIHPVDCLLSILLCSDDFLCQDLLSRLAKCQLALPFILTDPFNSHLYTPLWAMCSIIKEWKSIDGNNKPIPHTCPIIKYPMPIISFIRIGPHLKNNLSKSKILNDVISDAHHDYFFHRDCRGGQYKSIIGRGLVDICWYLPSGKLSGTFPDAVTFLNLHGDARDYPKQCRFLSRISSMCIALISEEDPQFGDCMLACLTKFNSSFGGIYFLNATEKNLKGLKSMFENTHVINLTTRTVTRTAAEIKDTLRSRIKIRVVEMKDCKSIEHLCHAYKENIVIDEDSVAYQKGLLHANNLRDIITEYGDKKPSVKEVMLPLQGEHLWKAWASNDKELHRQIKKASETIQEYTAKIESMKNSLRSGQLTHVKSLSSVMKLFIESLLDLQRDNAGNLRNYFLQSLKLELNSLSRGSISEKQYEYQKIRKELSKIQAESHAEKNEMKSEMSRLQNELEILQEDIIDSSFGLEHLLRELGQVYEAAVEGKLNDEDTSSHGILDFYISSLPKAAAELLIEGYPLELMDGDAAHVPLGWVIAVIKEAASILHDPKVFVLSVLGLQSTGKSTMLNTTFGLQFNVSAGRCTRGAFMQLLPLDQELKNRTKCSYVIIVDTEGLRAPELDPLKTQKHDNQLATFVIGLANMTLINIYGEVPGDIDDILQTSVHAFLRMNKVQYYPSCQFVHQNAGVNIRGEVSRAKFSQKLNRFTSDAAREEQCEGQFETFNDVIKFDDQSDVHYFPGLWKGDPPMAPVNEGYSQTAQSLKHQLVQIICKRASISSSEENIGDLSLSSFHVKINDLWNTLLKEKFVFSFKNTLEITAYNSLETAYSSWDWRFQSAMLEWEQKAENEISTEPLETLNEKVEQKLKELTIYVTKSLYEPVKEEMEFFFNGKQSEILIQWKAKFEIRLEMLSKEVRLHAEDHCNNLLRAKQAISEFEMDRQMNVEFIKKKVQEHIEIVRKEQEELNESLEKKKLNPEQIKKLLARNLFKPEQLNKFKKDEIITSNQASQIKSMMKTNKGQLNESILKRILKEEVLDLNQVQVILKKTPQTEEQLQHKFDEIWSELMKQLPRVKLTKDISVERPVEKALTKFVEGKGHHGLIHKLQERTLRQRGPQFELQINEKHFLVNGMVHHIFHVVRRISGTTDQHKIQAIEINNVVFDIALQYMEKTKKKNTDFKPAFIDELLRLVDDAISTHSKFQDCSITFTPAYRLDVYVTVCGCAVLQFEEMAQKFEERNNPRSYLEKHHKIPLFTKFKNQYKLTEAEEAIADTLCAYLEVPIRTQLEKSMGTKMVNKMKSSNNHYFGSKMALKVKILTDLHEENKFESFMLYVRDVKKCLQSRIRQYTIQYCDEKVGEGQKTHLQITTEEEVARLISVVETVAAYVSEKDVRKWVDSVCNDMTLRRELGVDLGANDLLVGYDSLQELNVENFKLNIKKRLQELKRKALKSYEKIECAKEMVNWKDQPHQLLRALIGCTEQCPFCGEQCDLLEHDDSCDHRTEVHRITCLAGWRCSNTQAMTTSICPIQVDSEIKFRKPDGEYHPYKDYKTVYPKWFIPPDKSAKTCSYWKWFVGKYQHELVEEFQANASKIPKEWSTLKWPSIKQDLKTAYNIEFLNSSTSFLNMTMNSSRNM